MSNKDTGLAILAHPKPMKRHTSHVVPASFEARIRLPELHGSMPSPGLHLELKFADGSTQLLIFPLGYTLEKLVEYACMAAALKEVSAIEELVIPVERAKKIGHELLTAAERAEAGAGGDELRVRLGATDDDITYCLVVSKQEKA